jgi:hypothetical protein
MSLRMQRCAGSTGERGCRAGRRRKGRVRHILVPISAEGRVAECKIPFGNRSRSKNSSASCALSRKRIFSFADLGVTLCTTLHKFRWVHPALTTYATSTNPGKFFGPTAPRTGNSSKSYDLLASIGIGKCTHNVAVSSTSSINDDCASLASLTSSAFTPFALHPVISQHPP